MYISNLSIQNYRTFEKVDFHFDSRVNYVVGDNNIGKSNLLKLLKGITHGEGFRESDFLDADEPIEIWMTLTEEGVKEEIHLHLVQHVQEVVPRLFDADSGDSLPLEYMRCLFYMDFGLFEVPRNMLTDQLVTQVLLLFQQCFSYGKDMVDLVETRMNDHGFHLSLPRDNPKQASLDFFRAVFGTAPGGNASHFTDRLIVAIGAVLLAKMKEKKESKAISFENMVITDDKGRRYLTMLLSIDEPELHLHPYLQRAILAFVRAILRNEEPFFLRLVQSVLGVDGLDGQLFVVTHSTDALVNDYRQIIRMYWDEKNRVQAACGASFRFSSEIEKHLIMHFPEVKEAMYSRCTILVEGETEYGSFGYFAQTLGVHLDYHGICLINARGESSISKIAQLIRRFHIPAVCLYDRDVMGEGPKAPYIFYTDYICYEMDVVKACLAAGSRPVLDGVISDMEETGDTVNSALIKKAGSKLGVPKGFYPPKKLKNINPRDEKALEFYYFAWLYGNKGVIIGRALGEHLTEKEIPAAFAKVIEAAKKLAE